MHIPLPYQSGLLKGLQIYAKGIHIDKSELTINMCKDCFRVLSKGSIPWLGLCNGLFLGDIPPELQDLTIIEESMIALCRAKCYVIQLKEDITEFEDASVQ
ncbi:hypothetical protein EDD18DRAFT_1078090 [Armillaria luteobubalina]|uniref:DUF6570 domain-containing protein n=1 Tax=Armillaria luteobubalina TaxID=153913 RepID=A0AA39Q203_9AGAR|nr:hypothetical protein EDD18DRAFT_1078090 [Armillaria luteobubalina]